MRTFIALAFVALLGQGVHAQSASGMGTLGKFGAPKKAPIASAMDLETAKRLSGQASKRLGAHRRSGWVSGGPGSWKKGASGQ